MTLHSRRSRFLIWLARYGQDPRFAVYAGVVRRWLATHPQRTVVLPRG